MQRIETLNDIHNLALRRTSVIVPSSHAFEKPHPAEFILHLQGNIIYDLLEMGMYVYERKTS